MEFKKIKTQIIDNVITPFLKDNGFFKKGKNYFMNKNHIIIFAEILDQEYNKEVIIENFLINMKVYLGNSNELPPFRYFKSYSIDFPEIIYLKMSEITDIDNLTKLLNCELEKLSVIINEYNSIENIIKKGKEKIYKLDDEVIELKKRIEEKSDSQSQNDVLKISLKLKEKEIEIINDWIQKRVGANVPDTEIA